MTKQIKQSIQPKESNQFNDQLLALNLQFFAEEAPNTDIDAKGNEGAEGGQTDATDVVDAETKPVTLTQEDVLKMIQSETDKVRTEYSNKLKDKEKELDTIRTEKMTGTEKIAHEQELLKQENATLKQEKLRYVAIEQLALNSMPVEIVEFVVSDSIETIKDRIAKFKAIFDKAVTDKASETFKAQGTKHIVGVGEASSMSKTQFNGLTVTERTKLKNDSPELYNKLLSS